MSTWQSLPEPVGNTGVAKVALRDQLLTARRRRSLVEVGEAARAIAEHVLAAEEVRRSATIACYVSVGTEPGTTALLELKIVEMGPFPSEEAARQAYNNAVPPDLEIVPGSQDVAATGGGTPATVYYVVRRVAPMSAGSSAPVSERNRNPTSDSGGNASPFSRPRASRIFAVQELKMPSETALFQPLS